MPNKRKPASVHKLQGTYRKDRHGGADNALPAALCKPPTAPAWLPAEAKREWRRVVKAMAENNVLTLLDRAIMTQYCLLYAQMAEAPELFTASLHTQLRLCMVELGFTPSAHSKLHSLRQDEEDDDPDGWGEFSRGR